VTRHDGVISIGVFTINRAVVFVFGILFSTVSFFYHKIEQSKSKKQNKIDDNNEHKD